jgi:hypothetical protein
MRATAAQYFVSILTHDIDLDLLDGADHAVAGVVDRTSRRPSDAAAAAITSRARRVDRVSRPCARAAANPMPCGDEHPVISTTFLDVIGRAS